MNTEQKYGAQASSQTFLDLTAQKPVNQNEEQSPCLEHPMAEEWRQNHFRYMRELREQLAAQTPAIDEEVSVFDLVDRFVSETPSEENVRVIRELERAWLDQKDPKLADTRVHIHTLRILTFLVAIHKKWTNALSEAKLIDPLYNEAAEGIDHE